MTAGMATSRPKAVVTSASAMPAETEPRPPEPVAAMAWKAVMMPATVPSRPTNGAVEPMVASEPRPRRMSVTVRSVLRSMARFTAATMSNSPISCLPPWVSWDSSAVRYSSRARPRTLGR